MSLAKKFQLLGSGDGWPVRNLFGSINVRPFIPPTSNTGTVAERTAIGFKRFCTLGGYTDSNSGNPTQKQLDLSLINAMKLFYNTKSSNSGGATANISGVDGSNLSVSTNSLPYKSKSFFFNSDGSFVQKDEVLTPRERVLAVLRKEIANRDILHTDRLSDSFSVFEAPIGSNVSFLSRIQIVKLFDDSGPKKVFLGYGVNVLDDTFNVALSASAGFEGDGAYASVGIGSFFNPRFFINELGIAIPGQPEPIIEKEVINTVTLNNMPFLSKSFISGFFPSNNFSIDSSSLTNLSASVSGGDTTCSASVSLGEDFTFYTYEE